MSQALKSPERHSNSRQHELTCPNRNHDFHQFRSQGWNSVYYIFQCNKSVSQLSWYHSKNIKIISACRTNLWLYFKPKYSIPCV